MCLLDGRLTSRRLLGNRFDPILLGARSWSSGRGSYAYANLKNVSNPELQFTHPPTHAGRLFVEAVPRGSLYLRGRVSSESGRPYRIEGTTMTDLDRYTRVDLEIAYRFHR